MVLAGCKGEEKEKPARAPSSRSQANATPRAPAAEKTGDKVLKKVATAQGTLTVLRRGTGAAAEYSVKLGDRELVEPRYGAIEVAAVHGKPARLVLLRLAGTTKACPALFRVVESPKGRKPQVSDEFGNCSSKPSTTAVGGGWKVSFPRFGNASAKSWTYADGEVRLASAK
jgi:hypothetical protein